MSKVYVIYDKRTGGPLAPTKNWRTAYMQRRYAQAGVNRLNEIIPDNFYVVEETVSVRSAVDKVLERADKSDLYLRQVKEKKMGSFFASHSLEDVVYELLKATLNSSSFKASNETLLETGSGRRRSSLDIWRHLKKYSAALSIYDVMDALFSLSRGGKVSSNYCTTVHRRVFYIQYAWDYRGERTQPSPYQSTENFSTDEYGLKISAWKGISKDDSTESVSI